MKKWRFITALLIVSVMCSPFVCIAEESVEVVYSEIDKKLSVTGTSDNVEGTDVTVIVYRPHYGNENISSENVAKAVEVIAQTKVLKDAEENGVFSMEYILPEDAVSGKYTVLTKVETSLKQYINSFTEFNMLRHNEALQKIAAGEDIAKVLSEYAEDISLENGEKYYNMNDAEKNCVCLRISDRNNFLTEFEGEVKRIELIRNFVEKADAKTAEKLIENYDILDISADTLSDFQNLNNSNTEESVLEFHNKIKNITDPYKMDIDFMLSESIKIAKNNDTSGSSTRPSAGGGGGGGGGGRGGSISAGGAVLEKDEVKLEIPQNPVEGSEELVFDDLDDVEWAKKAIKTLYDEKVVNGKGDNKFCPNDNITRAEFVKILCNVFDLDTEAEIDVEFPFADVSDEDWFYPYVKCAYAEGVVSGLSETEFGSAENITREDMVVMIFRRMSKGFFNNYKRYAMRGHTIPEFSDMDNISDYALEAVENMRDVGYISGNENSEFMPKAASTRAEAAQLIYNVFYK